MDKLVFGLFFMQIGTLLWQDQVFKDNKAKSWNLLWNKLK